MLIRKASATEMLELWGFEDENTASATTRFFYHSISSGNAVFWTVDNDGELIGELYAFLNLDDKDFADGQNVAYLCAFRIKKEYRGRGLGSSLVNAAFADLKEKGFRCVTIGVSSDEPQNIRLYKRLGFIDKVKDCYYDPCSLDDNNDPEYDESGWWLLSKDLWK